MRNKGSRWFLLVLVGIGMDKSQGSKPTMFQKHIFFVHLKEISNKLIRHLLAILFTHLSEWFMIDDIYDVVSRICYLL